jgi:hypothetical protein
MRRRGGATAGSRLREGGVNMRHRVDVQQDALHAAGRSHADEAGDAAFLPDLARESEGGGGSAARADPPLDRLGKSSAGRCSRTPVATTTE